MPLFALLTDFGTVDPYVAQMKGVLLRDCPGANICDVSHHIQPQDVASAAWVLSKTMPHFPEKTIFVGVVDPGVGTDRPIIAAEIGRWLFVGPDNGLASLAIQEFDAPRIVAINLQLCAINDASNTFHGRDIMAPIAAKLGSETAIDSLGHRLASVQPLHRLTDRIPPDAQVSADRRSLQTAVQYIDRFGNVVLASDSRVVEPWTWLTEANELHVAIDPDQLETSGRRPHVARRVTTYGNAKEGTLVLLEGSQGQFELAVTGGSAAQLLSAKVGDAVELLRSNT